MFDLFPVYDNLDLFSEVARMPLFYSFFQSLLHDPNVNSPANNEAARLYKENRREYEKKVAAVVQESWVEDEGDEVEDNVKDSENDGDVLPSADSVSS